MTNKNFLSKIRGLSRALQSSDVGFDCRSTVGSPSGFHRSTVLKLCTVLVLVLTIGVGNAWGATYSGSFVNYTGTLIDGYYLIVASNSASSNANYAMGSTADSNKRIAGTSVTISSNTISNPNDQLVFLIESNAAGTGFCFKNYNTSNYVFYAANSSGKSLNYGTTAYYHTLSGYNSNSPVGYKFTIAGTAAGSNNVLKYNTSNKWFSGYSGAYSTSMTPVRLFRLAKFRAKTTQPASGSFTASATSATWDPTNKHLSWMSSGATVTLTATPPSSGKAVNAWTIKNSAGTDITSTVSLSGHTNTATFTMPADQVTISVTWKDSGTSVSLSKAATSNGSFSLSSDGPLNTTSAAQTITVTGSPNSGYYLSSVTQSGASAAPTITKTSATTYTIQYAQGCTGTSTISVTFSPIWQLRGDFNTWGTGNPCTTIADGVASTTIDLAKNTKYEFQFYDASQATDAAAYHGNGGNIVEDISGWTFATGNPSSNCKIFTGKAGTYTFKINMSTKAVQIIYPTVSDHPNDAYNYFKKWADWNDNYYVHWWGASALQDYNSAIRVTKTATICETDYVYFPILTSYTNFIVKDAASGDGSHKTGDVTSSTSHGGDYHDCTSWREFETYTISYDKGTGSGATMASETDICPGGEQALSANTYTKDHYHFTGWIADRDVTINSATVTQGTLITGTPTIENIQHDIELTAQWEADSYSVTATLTNVTPSSAFPSTVTYTGSTTTALNRTLSVNTTNFFLPTSVSVTMGGSALTLGTDFTYDNSTGAFAVSKVITGNIVITATAVPKLKSIAITTPPTTRAYLVGDVFSSTDAVVTATMGDGSTKAVTASATWTPAGALSAGTSQTVTATYTEAGIEKTATTTIDVYSVTVNKVNMSGTAIADAGVTASCSGRTLSQSVSTTNYKFNSWVVTAGGVSVSTNTITGTPTGNVTINAKFHDPITVTWLVGSGAASGSPTTEVKYNTAITALPSTPADNALASCGTNKFMGWTALGELKGTGNDAPADLFTTVGGAANLTTNTTYRAVFAKGSGSGSEGYNKVTSTGNITNDGRYLIVYESGNVAFNGNLTTLDASSNVVTATVSTSAIAVNDDNRTTLANAEFSIDMTNKYIKSHSNKYINYNSYGGGLTASADATAVHSISIDGSGNLVIEGTGQNSSSPYDYVVLRFNSNTGSGNWRFRFYKGTQQAIQLYKYDPGTTYSDYQTGCCSAPGTALSITSANSVATGGTVSLTSTGGNGGTVTWSVVNGTGSATVAGTTLTAGSIGTVTVKAHQDANTVSGTEYCAQDAEQAFTVVSSTVNVTGVTVDPTTKAIVPGETFDITPTISPSNATDKSVSWTSSASDKASVSGGTVTGVAAGTATITCTTTDGSHTATTAVTVYGVTMQALDEDGNAIAVGGPGTPSRTGASISPAADAGNYVFKEWAISGATLGSSASTKANTITNPTGAVTVTAKYYKPRTVKWSVNGNDSYNTGGPTTTVAYNGTISTVPTNPSGLACASTFVAWTDAAHNNGQTAKDNASYYGSALYTAAGDFPNITAETTTFYAVFAEGGGAAVNTTMWSEDWTGATTASSPSDDAKPSAQGTHTGKTVYGAASVSYKETSNGTYVRAETNAGGTSPELLLKGGNTWTIEGIPTGGAATLTLEYRINGSATVSTSTDKVSVGTRSGSNPYTNTITIGSGVTAFDLSFTETSNRRIDNVSVKVASVSLTNYVTECDANIVKVTYNANGGSTSCTNTTTDKTEDFTVCGTEPTRDYYTFAGWLCSADDEVYAASATISAAAIDADFTLTAQWTPVPYSITYELYGGTNSGSNPATYNVTTATITLQDPTKGHDRFEGWYSTYSAGVYSDQVTSIPLGSHGDITLHAKWAERHEIIFDADGVKTTIYRADDENMEDAVAGQGSVPSDPSAPTACSSKVFVGWSESTIDGETDTEPGDLMKPAAGTVDADKHYYAVWANESSESGTVYLYNGSFEQVTSGTEYGNKGKWTTSKVYGTGTAGEVRMSSGSASGSMDLDLSDKTLATTITVTFKMKRYGTEAGTVTLSCMDDGSTASFGSSPFSYPSGDDNWHDYSSTVTSVNNAKTNSIHFTSTSGKRVYVKDVVVSQIGTVYSYSAYSTSCCATKIVLSDPSITDASSSGSTITFDKSSPVYTCGGTKTVTATLTLTAGYQASALSFAVNSGTVSISPAISTPVTSSQVYTLTFAEDQNATLTTTATIAAKPLNGITITPSSGEVYVGQYTDFTVSYDPADYISPGYTLNATPVYVTKESAAPANTKLRLKGGRGSGPGASITETVNETVTIKASGDNTKTASVEMTVKPLPRVHFEDLVHGKAFADVVATIAENALNPNKTTKTSVDWVTPNANSCEENHLHLVGWIREDWPALVAYLNGTGDAPTTTAIVGAGNDGSGHAYYFAAGASINVQIFDGVTFYAVWSKVE